MNTILGYSLTYRLVNAHHQVEIIIALDEENRIEISCSSMYLDHQLRKEEASMYTTFHSSTRFRFLARFSPVGDDVEVLVIHRARI